MIRKGTDEDFEEIFTTINDAAIAYKGFIPPDRWHEPYMTKAELQAQIHDGVRFSCYVDNNEIVGVMGIQDKVDVELIRPIGSLPGSDQNRLLCIFYQFLKEEGSDAFFSLFRSYVCMANQLYIHLILNSHDTD